MTGYSLADLAEQVGAKLQGDASIIISGVAPLDTAQSGQISFLDNPSYKQYVATTQASAVILAPQYAADCNTSALLVNDPHFAYAKIANLFVTKEARVPGVHSSVQVDESAIISATASIGPYCIIGAGVIIGDHVEIGPNCYIGENTLIDKDTRLAARVSIYKNTKIGRQVIIHSGVVIASDGFGYANDKGNWYKIPQLGGVEIGDEVEIGANTCIDRGAMNNTIIENGVKLDNLIHIAHNVTLGAHTAIAACVAIAGSTKIGRYCMIGGCSAVGGHLVIADKVCLTGKSMVTHSIKEPGVYSSCTGSQPNKEWHKSVARFRQLDKLARKVFNIEKQLANRGKQDE